MLYEKIATIKKIGHVTASKINLILQITLTNSTQWFKIFIDCFRSIAKVPFYHLLVPSATYQRRTTGHGQSDHIDQPRTSSQRFLFSNCQRPPPCLGEESQVTAVGRPEQGQCILGRFFYQQQQFPISFVLCQWLIKNSVEINEVVFETPERYAIFFLSVNKTFKGFSSSLKSCNHLACSIHSLCLSVWVCKILDHITFCYRYIVKTHAIRNETVTLI